MSLCSIIRVWKLAWSWWRYFWELRPSKYSSPWPIITQIWTEKGSWPHFNQVTNLLKHKPSVLNKYQRANRINHNIELKMGKKNRNYARQDRNHNRRTHCQTPNSLKLDTQGGDTNSNTTHRKLYVYGFTSTFKTLPNKAGRLTKIPNKGAQHEAEEAT